ncbi:nucleoside hydrolase [Secundilactobacillus kimchicus]
MKKVILDCDPGHDDALALLMALASNRIDLQAVTTSAGNQLPEKNIC